MQSIATTQQAAAYLLCNFKLPAAAVLISINTSGKVGQQNALPASHGKIFHTDISVKQD